MRSLFQDLRYSFRSYGKNIGFSLTLILGLGLGIGGTTAVFTLFYDVVAQPLPFKEPGRLVRLVAPSPPQGDTVSWWNQDKIFGKLCQYQSGGINLTDGHMTQRVFSATVSTDFFAVFSVSSKQGRV